MAAYDTMGLKTLGPNGEVPDCRMKDASATQDWCRRMIDNDARRSFKRSRVNGLVDGNPPYRLSKLREAGRGEACNVNWGTGRSYLESGSGSFYDLTSEAPSAVTFRTSYGKNDQERERYSTIASKEADIIFKKERLWDYQIQLSQWDMVLHGCGPMFFEDAYQVFPRATLCGDLKVPEWTKSETSYWEGCFLQVDYFPPELYNFIRNEDAAKLVGWDVEYTKKVIYNAIDKYAQAGIQYDWEFFQQQMKNNSLTYYDDTKICQIDHVFWKEFDGRITHAMVERNTADGLPVQYLFLHIGRYANWNEAVHPMYYDHGNGGYHHSVTGLGVKMYSAMEFENRLLCNLCDKAFSPKILFKPTTTESSQKFSLVHLGDYAVLPAGFDWQQTGVAGLMNDGLAMREELTGVMQNVLSSYRQSPPSQKSGNPVTKFEKQMEAALQSALSMPQFNRYYAQCDQLIQEIWRRLSDPNSTDERAKSFQDKCHKQGVPQEALNRVEYVGATRVVGQGSAFMRKQAIDALFPLAGTLPESGRNNLIADKISAEAGQAAVQRYFPTKDTMKKADDQQAEAMQWVVAMKNGVAPIMTDSQNPVTFAATFLNSASQAVKSLQQGADPHEVYGFLQIAGPAIAAYMREFGQDPTRQQIHQAMVKQWTQLTKITDQFKKQLMQAAQNQKSQQSKTSQVMTDEQLATAKVRNDISIKQAKAKAQMQMSAEKHKLQMAKGVQSLQLADATAASTIHRENLKAFATQE